MFPLVHLLNGGLVCTQALASVFKDFSHQHIFTVRETLRMFFYKEYFYFGYITLCQK